ncbi:hypothetical protein T484DRAFT_1882441, partial [Baffinella frigidus]
MEMHAETTPQAGGAPASDRGAAEGVPPSKCPPSAGPSAGLEEVLVRRFRRRISHPPLQPPHARAPPNESPAKSPAESPWRPRSPLGSPSSQHRRGISQPEVDSPGRGPLEDGGRRGPVEGGATLHQGSPSGTGATLHQDSPPGKGGAGRSVSRATLREVEGVEGA